MTDNRFRELWNEILHECQLEYLPKKRLQMLATHTTEQDLRFLLEEAERIGREWAAIRESDAGDLKDDYWRMNTCVEEMFKLRGPEAAKFLETVAQDPGSPLQTTAARLLQSAAAHFNYEQKKAVRGRTMEPDPIPSFDRTLEKGEESQRWWQFWNKEK